MNEYMQALLGSGNFGILPENIQKQIQREAEFMSQLGVEDEEDHKQFLIILQHVPNILRNIGYSNVSEDDTAKIACDIFEHRKQLSLGDMFGFMSAVARSAEKFGLSVEKKAMDKVSYPQGYGGGISKPVYDIRKWINATRDIYLRMAQGESESEAEDSVTKNCDKMEKLNYKYWLNFYREKVPEKYPKMAGNFYTNESSPGMYIPNPIDFSSLKAHIPHPIDKDYQEKPEVRQDQNAARDRIESQRHKIVSRLNSAEKLLASMDGQFFAGDDQELMLKLLQDLKRRIQISNKLTLKSSLFEDLIYRTGNLLKSQGKIEPAGFFYKLAQLGAPPEPMGDLPDENLPGMPLSPDMSGGNSDETRQALQEFFDNLNNRAPGDPDDTAAERKASDNENDIVVMAQEIREPLTTAKAPPPVQRARPPITPIPNRNVELEKPNEDLTVKENDEIEVSDDKTDDIIDAALSKVNIHDVIKRLEMLVSIYNQREISRQINILDIMMDRIGLASFFPGLGEAMGKAIESGQYISTRLEDVLTKLKGSAETTEGQSWLKPQESKEIPETANIRRNLEQKRKEDEERKEKRREKELAKLNAPEPGQAPELNQPTQLPKPPAAPIVTR